MLPEAYGTFCTELLDAAGEDEAFAAEQAQAPSQLAAASTACSDRCKFRKLPKVALSEQGAWDAWLQGVVSATKRTSQ